MKFLLDNHLYAHLKLCSKKPIKSKLIIISNKSDRP